MPSIKNIHSIQHLSNTATHRVISTIDAIYTTDFNPSFTRSLQQLTHHSNKLHTNMSLIDNLLSYSSTKPTEEGKENGRLTIKHTLTT